MTKRPSRPRDTNELARRIVDLATGEARDPVEREQSPMAELGQRGGKKGGAARAANLTPEQRSEIARKAAAKRWSKD
jgi:hypothetical protein